MAMLILAIGLMASPAMRIFETWKTYENSAETNRKIEYIQKSLSRFFVENGRYPCPSSLNAQIDSSGFGHEILSDCTASDEPGTFRASGRDGRTVRTGAVPVRTLGINDSYLFDNYRNRFVYAVTEVYAVAGTVTQGDQGAIAIIDPSGNQATSDPGNVVYTVFSTGGDPNGSFTLHGALQSPCDTSAVSGENCDYTSNATFRNAAFKSLAEGNYFVHTLRYSPNKTVRPCTDESGGGGPKDVAFIIDTSESMEWEPDNGNFCPAHMPGCSRMDIARWAIRRVMPVHLAQNWKSEDPGKTSLTGFIHVGGASSGNPSRRILEKIEKTNILFDDPSSNGHVELESEDLYDAVDKKLKGMCPKGGTPLGEHILGVARKLGDGNEDRPNKITVLSDGESNGRLELYDAAKEIQRYFPNIQVDIVDVTGTPSLREVASLTGGKYYRSDNPDSLLKSLNSSLGICQPAAPSTPPVDKRGCGSLGKW